MNGQIRFEPGYVWKWKFLYQERKSCWFKNFPMRVVGALVLLVIIYLVIFFILFFRLQRRTKKLKTTAAMGRQNSKFLNNKSLERKLRPDISRVYSNFPFALTCYTYLQMCIKTNFIAKKACALFPTDLLLLFFYFFLLLFLCCFLLSLILLLSLLLLLFLLLLTNHIWEAGRVYSQNLLEALKLIAAPLNCSISTLSVTGLKFWTLK